MTPRHLLRLVEVVVVFGAMTSLGWAQDSTPSVETRRASQNGIFVEQLKVYDDALLQTMLAAAQARLAAIQVLDQAGVAAKVGALSGAEASTSGFGLTAQTPALPGVTTTAKGPTQTTVQTANAEGTPTGTTTTSGLATTDVQTAAPQMTVPTVAPGAPTVSLPAGLGVSASDLLNEQMQLTYEIANLRLLLDGAVSDRLLGGDLARFKPRVTVGVPITIDPDGRHKDAVAVVELEIEGGQTLVTGEGPTVTALLPREKTYNVASIRESNVSIGGGMVTQVIGFGGSWLSGRKTYYVVQDQDTVATTFATGRNNTVGVAWQFRPVLGERFVKPGLKQTFVQVAFPTAFSDTDKGRIRVRTYWRKFDRKTGATKSVVSDSVAELGRDWPIPRFATLLALPVINGNAVEDLGSGTVMVDLEGSFLIGTAVRIGNAYLREGAPATFFSQRRVKFEASVSDLVRRGAWLVGRDGEEKRLTIQRAGQKVTIASASAVPLDDTNSVLSVTVEGGAGSTNPPLVLVVGSRVYGYSDAPLTWQHGTATVVVPTALVVANPSVTVSAVLAPEGFGDTRRVDGLDVRSRVERLTVVGQTDATVTYLLYGYRLGGASVVMPRQVTLDPIGGAADSETLRLVTLQKSDLKLHKHLVLQRRGERPLLVTIPGLTPPADPAPRARARVVLSADIAVFESERLAELTGVTYRSRSLPFEVARDGKAVTVRGLGAAGATAAADTVSLEFSFGATKVVSDLEVVNARVETVPKTGGER